MVDYKDVIEWFESDQAAYRSLCAARRTNGLCPRCGYVIKSPLWFTARQGIIDRLNRKRGALWFWTE
jgi:hypothetical protein